ncbi:hypothetical protein N802_18420 [Knoellia sinensis KCTC 19936]|uniref:Glycosyltransferase RgtA/B/C/D-like domain-containing protein n=1 Tax=Knoellia sinensis KCTC 19936 TaxID=1385520 RepID=A0A0A0J4R9_9MICO|nr:hypothetical protein [Knoellia sinensis]KGN32340.1 hypothetical protein N802_18420 [Knoellia sinensis KCTC 19936]
MLPGLVLLMGAVRALQPVSDPDTFWHIAAGGYLWEHWAFSGPDPWSDMSTQPWRLHEWLPQLGMSALYDAAGLPAVAWLLPVGVVAILLSLWWWLRRSTSLLITALLMAVVFVGMSGSLSLRPHLVTFALTVVTSGAWLQTSLDGKSRWWLVPVTWVWACSHGMWFIGPIIGVVVVVGMCLDRRLDLRACLRLVLVPIASVIAACLTPVGPGLLLSPFEVSEYTSYVQEWQSPSIRDVGFAAFVALCGVLVLIWARRGRPVPWVRVLLVGSAVGLALLYARTVPVGMAILAPVAALEIQKATPLLREKVSRREVGLTLGAALAGLTLAGALVPSTSAKPGAGANDLDSQLSTLPAGTTVCNDYVLGGWLIWKHPNIRPAVDGRTEIYGLDYFKAYLKFQSGSPGWEEYVGRVGCSFALLAQTDAPAAGLVHQQGWSVVRAGERYVLLRAPN